MSAIENGLVALPGGRRIPLQRAIRMGLVDGEGNMLKPAPDSQAAAVMRKAERTEAWQKQQTGGPKRKPRQVNAAPGEPETTADGKIRRKREPKPLVPQNVDHDGQPITDEEALAKIAAETAAIEAAKAAEVVAVPEPAAEDDGAEPASEAGGD